MPEIKNTFNQGKMNKDLDERLVPNGQYRDALNVDVVSSDGSNAGVVKNISGNVRVEDVIPAGSKCVGSISNELTNKLYWFVKGENEDYITEYDKTTGNSRFVALDKHSHPLVVEDGDSFLKFSGNPITGINIIDDFLFWTDGETEPKKLNISEANHTIDQTYHSRLYVNGEDVGRLSEEHVTVIKKKPSTAPTFKINYTEASDEDVIFEKIFPRFCFRYKYKDGEYSAFGPFTDVVFNANYVNNMGEANAYHITEPYNRAMVNSIKSIDLYDFIPSDIPKDVVQVDILYKQENSNVIYSIANIKNTDPEWSVDGSSQFHSGVWTVSQKGKYTVTTENIHAALPESQLLRAWDNVPRTALAQEIVGNRVVYGNYTQGYNIDPEYKPIVHASVEARENDLSFAEGGLRSIKSKRDYQLGVVFGDKYGRETPVFTSPEGSVSIPWETSLLGKTASKSLAFSARLNSDVPSWVDYYKFYVKQTSGEYYNLIMDKAYRSLTHTDYLNEENHIWISFPSSDRNKISEDDFISIKKVYDNNTNQFSYDNRFKILDIKNEAPEAIKYTFGRLGLVANTTSNVLTNLFVNTTNRIDAETDVIKVDRTEWLAHGNAEFGVERELGANDTMAKDVKDLAISWKVTNGGYSKRYKVTSVRKSSASTYELKLKEKITAVDAALATNTSSSANLNTSLNFYVDRREVKDAEDFSGKFFVKIANENILSKENLDLSNTNITVDSKSIYWAWDTHNNTDNNQLNGILNSQNNSITAPSSVPSSTGLTNTKAEWATLKTTLQNNFFIDNMYFASASSSPDSYAIHSGQGWAGHAFNSITNGSGYASLSWSNTGWITHHTPNGRGTSLDLDPSANGNSVVNGFEGIIESSSMHTDGIRRWRVGTSGNNYDYTYGAPGDTGKFYMHLSFLAPGVDLHDNSWPSGNGLTGVTINGEDGIAKHMQGIWGGGAFSKVPTSPFSTTGPNATPPLFGNSTGAFVEFTENYPSSTPPSPLAGRGFDSNYKTQHERQWDPTYPSDPNGEIQSFLNKIKTPGRKFKFSGDSSGEVYTIMKTTEKRVYNHTPWRLRWDWNGSGFVAGGDSVEEAASDWADSSTLNGSTDNTKANTLKQRIVDFGKANNRRVCYIIELDKNPNDYWNPIDSGNGVDLTTATNIEFLEDAASVAIEEAVSNPILWETEPQQLADLNIYHEASGNIPTKLTKENRGVFVPIGSRATMNIPHYTVGGNLPGPSGTPDSHVVGWYSGWDYRQVTLNPGFDAYDGNGNLIDYNGSRIRFYKNDGSYVTAVVDEPPGSLLPTLNGSKKRKFVIKKHLEPGLPMGLSWYNCFSFGNGIESNRIRDGFNEMQITNGARVSATLEEPYSEEHRKSGLIYSGIYNSSSGVNNLNQFLQAEKITKDLNPTYGSIQKLFTRNTDLIALCEDRVLKILANKDALYNADGTPQLIASANVLGQAVPFVGDYGISKNPESFASESYRAYFADKQRGSILRLSMDGLTPISDAGMREWFRDNLKENTKVIGSYDDYSKQYNVTIAANTYNNILDNSSFTEGEDNVEYFNANNIAKNGNFNAGPEFTSPQTLQQLWNTGGNKTLVNNRYFASTTTITNHPAIPYGSIQQPQPAVPSWPASSSVFITGSNPNSGSSSFFGDNLTTPSSSDPFSTTIGSGTPAVFFRRDFVSSDSTQSETPTTNDNYIKINHDSNNGHKGIVFTPEAMGGPSYVKSIKVPYAWIGSNTVDVMPDVANWTNNPQNVNNVDYSSVTSNTIFNGEEVQVLFDIKRDTTVSWVGVTHVRIELYDGDTLIPDSKIHTPSGGVLPYGDIANSTATSGSALLDIGYVNTSTYDFSTSINYDNTAKQHNIKFKFTDGTTNEGIVVNDLVVKISVVGGGQNTSTYAPTKQLVCTYVSLRKKYRLKTPENPGFAGSPALPAIPSANQAAWTEVEHNPPANWTANSKVNLNYGNEELYGLANPGSTTPSGYYIGTNNSTTIYNQYSDGSKNVDALEAKAHMYGFDSSGNPSGAYLYQDISSNPFQVGRWYMIDVDYDVANSPDLDTVALYGALDYNTQPAYGKDHTDNHSSYPEGFFGRVGGLNSVGGVKHLVLLPATRNSYSYPHPVLRGIFKVTPNSWLAGASQASGNSGDLNTITLQAWNSDIVVKRISILDITHEFSFAEPNNWGIHNSSYDIGNVLTSPTVYYKNGKVNWNTTEATNKWLYQNLPSNGIQPTNDGYELNFDISNNVDTNTIAGGLKLDILGKNINGSHDVISIQNIVDTGSYSAKFKLDGSLLSLHKDGSPSVSATISHFTSSSTNHNKIELNPMTSVGFIGAIDNISLTDATNYFSGGSIGSWNISGFDATLDDYITWDNGMIKFNNAPSTTQLEQVVGNLTEGFDFELSFNVDGMVSGAICGYYYNSNGKGFSFMHDSNSDFKQTFNIGEETNVDSSKLLNTLVVYPCGGSNLNASIDNISLKRVITNHVPKTISFNEDAKGWISFKSFHPESGVSLSNSYFTMKNGGLWEHNINDSKNSFYDQDYPTTITAVLNASPSSIKNFNTIGYEGSKAKVEAYGVSSSDSNINTLDIHNALTSSILGWEVEMVETDMQNGFVDEFLEKEGKWFNYIRGLNGDIDTSNFSFQGLGIVNQTNTND